MRALIGIATAAMCALGAAPASGAVSTSNSGWSWGNPRPQGNTLNAIDFASGRGYAVGDFGTVVRTDDGGSSWTGVITGVSTALTDVDAVDANTVVAGGGCVLRRSTDGGASFQRLPFTSSEADCPAGVRAFSFTSADNGFVLVADGTVLRTDDGGHTFARKTAIPGTSATGSGAAEPSDLFFTSSSTGFASTRNGNLYRTTDGAESWTLMANDGAGFNDIVFVGGTGYAVGPANNLWRSDDGGAVWSKHPLAGAPARRLTFVACSSPAVCLIATEEGDVLIRTTDGGDTGSAVTPSTRKIFAVGFASPTRAAAVGERGATSVSDDAGVNFATVGGRVAGDFTRLRATSPAVAHAAGANGTVARSTDGGQTWTTIGVSTSESVTDVSFPGANTGFAIDSSGTAFRTDNGGGSWRILNTGGGAANAILAPEANTVLVAGRGIRRSSDGGDTFGAVGSRAVRRTSFRDMDDVGSAVFAFASRALFVSTNHGASWRSVRRPPGRLLRADFVSARTGFALTTSNRLWRTTSRGHRWTELRGTAAVSSFTIAFSSARDGYISHNGGILDAASGFVSRTSDGGRTWRPQLVSREVIRDGGLVALGGTDFAMNDIDDLFATNSGGDAGAESTLRLTARRRTVKRGARAVVRGTLSRAEGGERVVISFRRVGGSGWAQHAVTVASNGTFTTRRRLRRATVVVAQWRGDDDRRGAGSPPLRIGVRR